jgi:hypothetical protein
LIKKLQDRNCYVAGGVPYYWREGKEDSKPGWLDVYKQYDMLIPWSVGRYANVTDLEHHVETYWKPDKEFCDAHGIDLQRVIYPGFAWSNLKGHQDVPRDRTLSRHMVDQDAEAPANEIPRLAGAFFWAQAYNVAQLKTGAFIAMFDEYDEATAIAKAAPGKDRIPPDQYFLTLDEDGKFLSPDFYLRLAGEATLMIRGGSPPGADVPIHPLGYRFYIKTGYRAILGREPGQEGFNAYLRFFKESGGTVERFCEILADSEEFKENRKNLPAGELAGELLKIWGRNPPQAERDGIVREIETGGLAKLTAEMMKDPGYYKRAV